MPERRLVTITRQQRDRIDDLHLMGAMGFVDLFDAAPSYDELVDKIASKFACIAGAESWEDVIWKDEWIETAQHFLFETLGLEPPVESSAVDE